MAEIDPKSIGLKVGLEIHQQLATNKKLFCDCPPLELDEYDSKFSRKLRVSKSEMGEYDPAALFENIKSKTIVYCANEKSSCLVERDEEPPHDLDNDAKKIVLIIASALKSNIFSEVYPMRKMVLDGSNTSGFQRTMLVSQGGYLDVDGEQIGVQSICLEEDAAKLLGDKDNTREYSLDRLGVPLIEIALEPVSADSKEMKKIALTLGRLLRTTKKVTRGLGSIRQDVNVSITGGGIVEVKGVQQLDQLEKVVEYEAKRQHGLQIIAKKLHEKNLEKISNDDIYDITEFMKKSNSKIIKNALKTNAIIKVVKIKNFSGMFSFSPYDGIRLGKELGQLVRFFGIGGVFHSDELPNYGIELNEVKEIRKIIDANEKDAFLIIAADNVKIRFAIESIIQRIESAKYGVPSETRLATQTGETVYLRPKPGASRMYPETDIPPIIINKDEIEFAKKNIPKSWDESLKELQEKYNLNQQLAEQIFDSDYLPLFEKISSRFNILPNFVASTLCSTITNLQRQEFSVIELDEYQIMKSFELLDAQKISKESLEIIFSEIMSGKVKSVEEAIEKSSITNLSDEELEKTLEKIVQENLSLVKKQGQRSVAPLMGVAMKSLRGKAPGEKINQILQEKIKKLI
ncbi:MAG: Glu-tRNA(Gln) amidotransferase GatDE subunit E [Crenarchaeota archaeon]|nr:MAG: Glu-tRNA(Gln) amidotransferase GatDE subunit E [Thermoproteota archaeon]RDJ33373.1 MAG: Glu-tRNA(Gln) amidotransferase GatDE subunit E [Thermoproteota archaeon]RDJ36122.1 MAG: Glu-tRNA(Gln) amidotransferase GatDE subunit E [Thermoproteota archaeon]RDJ38754.1 MAG: Glu-tRNA(Gln) amidotransferase GatDE subunit E [Thermoproteota archaeon]